MQQIVHVDEAILAQQSEKGFSLVEVIIALLILTIVVLGVFSVFAFATTLNTGNSTRSQALAILQKEVELLRSAKFTPAVVSNVTTPQATCATADDGRRDVTGGVKASQQRCDAAGALYLVETTVDDDPFTTAVQVNAASTLKDIMVTVTPRGQNGTWMSAYRTRALIRRVRAN
jgi:prepilin-type N-terminal cleavage/methylation domain-containing protein